MADLSLPIFCAIGSSRLEGRQTFDPRAKVIGEYKGAATTFHRPQLARLDRLIKRRSASAGDGARLGDRVGQGCIHRGPLCPRCSSFAALAPDLADLSRRLGALLVEVAKSAIARSTSDSRQRSARPIRKGSIGQVPSDSLFR